MNDEGRLDRIEQTIERITQRHEALSQSLELMVSMRKDNERHFEEHLHEQKENRREQEQRFDEHRRLVSGAIRSLAETDRKLTQMLAGMREEQKQDRREFSGAIMRLSVIAEAHRDTLDDHQKRLGH